MTDSPCPSPAAGVSHVDALPVSTRLAEFEILGLLGVGGFGMVYRAFDHSLRRSVAIKEYMPSALAGRSQGQSLWVRSSDDQATYQAGLASFVGEARLLAKFDHPSLVKVFRFWESNNTAYMVMPLYSGMTFKQARLHMRTPPPEAWLRKVLWSVLGALRVLHEGKTLHRDISPDNIFLQDNGPPVLLDLGAARHAINDQDRQHTAVLKVNYAPIEQYTDDAQVLQQGPWSDLYSLAAVVHGCLCNDTPLPATLRSIRDRMVPFSRVAKTVKRQFGVEYSAPLVAAISRSLALKPEDRPQNIDEFLVLMRMSSAPDGVEHFDFRAELGAIWEQAANPNRPKTALQQAAEAVPVFASHAEGSSAASGFGQSLPVEGLSVPLVHKEAVEQPGHGDDRASLEAGDTISMDDSRYEDIARGRTHVPSGARATRSQPQSVVQAPVAVRASKQVAPSQRTPVPRPSALRWVALVVLVVVVAAGGLRWMMQGRGAAPGDDIITEMAERPAAPTAEDTAFAQTVPAAAEGQTLNDSATVNVALVGASASSPAGGGASAVPRTAPRAAKRPVAEAVAAPVVVAPEPAPQPPPVVAPKPVPVVAPRLPTPQEACADASFIARPMCIHQECQKPGQVKQSICVENRRRFEAEEERRRQTPN
jgi:serine/threonine protein kinase